MKKRGIFVILILLLVGGLLIWNLVFDNKSESEIIGKAIAPLKITDTGYNAFLEYSLQKAIKAMNLHYKINLNKPYQEDQLNVYVVDFGKMPKNEKIGKLTHDEFASYIQGNFIAIPPNLILIDKYFLSYLILNCYNEELAYDQATIYAFTHKFKTTADMNEFLQTSSAIATYLSLGNYYGYLTHDKSELNVDSLAGLIINNRDTSEIAYQQFYIYLMPILTHELVHILKHNKEAMGWIDIKSMVNKQLSDQKEEKEADDLSLRVIKKYINESKDNPQRFQALINFCRTMRNMVLSDTYKDFRGFAPANLVVTLEQNQDLTPEELRLPFHYFQRVARGYENAPPPMSEEEFKSFIKTMNASGSSQSHRHMFQRCNGILDIIRAQTHAPIHFLDTYLTLLSVNTTDKKATGKLFVDDSLQASHLTRFKELKLLERNLVEKKAINFENNKIRILFFKNGSGYIELHGEENNLTKAVLVISTRGKNGELDETAVSNLVCMARFIANQYDNESEGLQKGLEAHALIRNKEGALPTFMMNSNNNIIKVTPMNESYYVRIEVSDFHNF